MHTSAFGIYTAYHTHFEVLSSHFSICTKINKEWLQVQANKTDGLRYSQVLIHSKATTNVTTNAAIMHYNCASE